MEKTKRYFISRIVTTIGENGYGLLDLPGYIDDLLEAALTPQNIFSTHHRRPVRTRRPQRRQCGSHAQ